MSPFIPTPLPAHAGAFWQWSMVLVNQGQSKQNNEARVLDALVLTHLMLTDRPQTSAELSALTGLHPSSISRGLRRLGHINRQQAPGLGLVKQEKDPREGRRLVYSLSPAGEEIATRINHHHNHQ